jgi:hypothetical protein
MKRILYAQFLPVKTMRQLVADRRLYRMAILTALLLMGCG